MLNYGKENYHFDRILVVSELRGKVSGKDICKVRGLILREVLQWGILAEILQIYDIIDWDWWAQ